MWKTLSVQVGKVVKPETDLLFNTVVNYFSNSIRYGNNFNCDNQITHYL